MSGEPAIRKVLDRLKTWLEGNVGTGVTVFVDRPYDESFHDADLPYVNIRCDGTGFEVFNYGTMLHAASIKFDIAGKETATRNVSEEQAEIAATLNARMWAMTMTAGGIGELLQDKLPVSLGAEQDEFQMSDAGETVFAWRLTWLTPLDDFRTIIGQNGLVA